MRVGKFKKELVLKSIGASILIGLGDFALLKVGGALGAFLFSLGLLGVCYLGLNLFTGKCGFWGELTIKRLLAILAVNLVSGYLFGWILGQIDNSIVSVAVEKMNGWEFSLGFLGKGVLCGMIMYIAVKLYREGTPLGILMGVPLFILCGFQHCIANVITMGIAGGFSWTLLLAVLGNWMGSLLVWEVSYNRI